MQSGSCFCGEYFGSLLYNLCNKLVHPKPKRALGTVVGSEGELSLTGSAAGTSDAMKLPSAGQAY